jgi:outer membrane lipoprotein carrier protein
LTRLLTILALLAGFSSPLSADTARQQLERFSAGLESLRATFSQVVIDNENRVQDSSAGKVWLQRPDRFRWQYGGDFPELVVGDGERIWIYDEMLEQVTVRSQAEAGVDSPLALLTDPGRLDESYEVREVGAVDEAELLELRSRSPESEFERFLLGLADDRPVLIVMEDAFGLRTEIRFEDVERNPPLDGGLFRFEPPPGVDVIGALSTSDESR